ncbi:hypothetical protein DER45DRAFT_590669 [Fusarium avenaceum]|nr:hypothetical protein DER45DRAFT_590669 [Fusarium avenaceum]
MTSLRHSHHMEELGISKAMSKMRKWRKSCNLEIELAHHYHAKIYSSGSVVKGHLVISPATDICASSIIISLDGTTTIRTVGQKLTTTTTHHFLKMDLISSDVFNLISKTLKKNQIYKIPFQFILPNELDPTACTHNAVSATITDKHLLLPPTMGGMWDRDDMSPGVVEIRYGINACIAATTSLSTDQTQDLMATRAIQFIPRSTESPPVHVSLTGPRYKLQGTKYLGSNSFKQPLGVISATAMQPEPLHLQSYGTVITPSSVDVTLTFNPDNDTTPPPKLEGVSLSVRSCTWHQAELYQAFPDQIETPSFRQPFTSTIALTVECPQITWTRHVDSRLDDKNQGNTSAAFYSSTLRLPLSLSSIGKMFLPTFHSCLVSRTYEVCLRLTFKKGGLTIIAPLQIIVEP